MARVNAKSVEFKLYAPQARKVSIAGSFNKWDTKADQAKKDSKGNWSIKLKLKPGSYEYKFFVDGNWMNDPRATSFASNAFGSQNCLIVVK